jgi:hypothetical protein
MCVSDSVSVCEFGFVYVFVHVCVCTGRVKGWPENVTSASAGYMYMEAYHNFEAQASQEVTVQDY